MRLPTLALGFLLGAFLFIGASLVLAWTGPTNAPPNGNISPPINVGATDQVKNAGLAVNSLAVFGNAILSGASRYLNFGDTSGPSGYGIRDNAGTIELKNDGGSWAAAGGLPSGAVMAFLLANCPTGWSPLVNAVGRVIVGAGTYPANADVPDASNATTTYGLGQLGGEMDHQLTIAEMPSHTHQYGYPTTDIHLAAGGWCCGAFSQVTGTTQPTGGDQPHENRQPYIALLYCKKD